jgi:hypothetical protein
VYSAYGLTYAGANAYVDVYYSIQVSEASPGGSIAVTVGIGSGTPPAPTDAVFNGVGWTVTSDRISYARLDNQQTAMTSSFETTMNTNDHIALFLNPSEASLWDVQSVALKVRVLGYV